MARNGGKRLGKVALAKQATYAATTTNDIDTDRARFNTMLQDYGVIFNTNNTVQTNDVVDKIDALIALFGLTFTRVNDRLVLDTENYTAHTHDYEDTDAGVTTTKTSEVAN